MKKKASLLFIFVATLTFALTEYPPQIKTESENQQGFCTLIVQTDAKDADVYVNLFYKGTAPVTLSGLKPDTYYISIKKKGFKERNLSLTLAANTKTTVYMNLIPYTGYLRLDSPQNISIKIDSKTYEAGLIELPVGSYNAPVRAFGYEQKTISFDIYQNNTTYQTVTLETADFRVDNPSFSNTKFNPRNAGLYGSTACSFLVSTYGYADILVTSSDGSAVVSWRSSQFATWEQELRWDGKDENGEIVPDGTYRITITFFDLSSGTAEKTSWSLEHDIVVDSSFVLYPSILNGTIPGSTFAAPAHAPSNPDFLVAAGISYDTLGSFDHFGALFFTIKAAGAIPGFGRVALSASVGSEPDFLNGSLGLLVPVYSSGLVSLGLSGSGVLRSLILGGSYAFIGLPVTIGSRQVAFTLAPLAALFWQDSIAVRGMLDVSIQYATYAYRVSLSANITTTDLLSSSFEIEPPVAMSLDLAFLPPESYIELSLWASLRLSGDNTTLAAGFLTAFRLFGGY